MTEESTITQVNETDAQRVLARSLVSFGAAWEYPLLASPASKIALFALLTLLCGIRAYVGLVGSRLYSHDAFMLFDGAWRMTHGQRPHIDFYSHVGFLTYVPTVVGLWISHGTAWGYGYGQALVGLCAGIWSYWLGRGRLKDVPLALFCVAVTLMATAPFAPGFVPLKMGPSTTYNRFGYVLLALILIEAVCESSTQKIRGEFLGGLSSGSILALLLFLKITYFAGAIFLLFLLIRCRPQVRQRWLGILTGFALVCFMCCAYFGFHMGPMLGDLRMIGRGKHVHFDFYYLDQILQDAMLAFGFALIAALLLVTRGQRKAALSVTIAGAVTALAGALLMLGNSERSGFPLAAFLAIVVLNAIITYLPEGGRGPDFLRVSALLFGSIFIVGSLASGGLGALAGVVGRVYFGHKANPLDSPILSGFVPAGDDYWYVDFINEGLSLVRKSEHPGDTVMSLDFTNPLSYSLGLSPAPGGTTVLQYKTTFDDVARPSEKALIGSATLVALPKKFSDESLEESIERLYGPYLKSHFRLVGESRYWSLYRRKGS